MTMDHRPLGLLVAAVCLLGSPALAGPPAICHEIDIGKSVQPLEKRSYSTSRLIDQSRSVVSTTGLRRLRRRRPASRARA